MGKSIAVVLAAIVLGVMVATGCGSSTPLTKYSDAPHQFSLSYPSEFLNPIDDPTMLAQLKLQSGARYVFALGSSTLDQLFFVSSMRTSNPKWIVNGDTAFYEASARKFARLVKRTQPDAVIVSMEASSLGGLNGIRVRYQRHGNNWDYYHLYREDAVFDVAGAYATGSSSTDVAKLESVLASFDGRPQASPGTGTAGHSQDELDYLGRIVQASKTLARAQALADRFATAQTENRGGHPYLRGANRLMSDLAAAWSAKSAPSLPSANLARVESEWLQALLYKRESLHYLTKGIRASSYASAHAAINKGLSYRKKGYVAQARAIEEVRRVSTGAHIPGLSADLGVNPYSFGDDEKVEYRRALWREYMVEALRAKPDMAALGDLVSQFDKVLIGRRAEDMVVSDWVWVVYIHAQERYLP